MSTSHNAKTPPPSTVGEMISFLKKYPKEMPIVVCLPERAPDFTIGEIEKVQREVVTYHDGDPDAKILAKVPSIVITVSEL